MGRRSWMLSVFLGMLHTHLIFCATRKFEYPHPNVYFEPTRKILKEIGIPEPLIVLNPPITDESGIGEKYLLGQNEILNGYFRAWITPEAKEIIRNMVAFINAMKVKDKETRINLTVALYDKIMSILSIENLFNSRLPEKLQQKEIISNIIAVINGTKIKSIDDKISLMRALYAQITSIVSTSNLLFDISLLEEMIEIKQDFELLMQEVKQDLIPLMNDAQDGKGDDARVERIRILEQKIKAHDNILKCILEMNFHGAWYLLRQYIASAVKYGKFTVSDPGIKLEWQPIYRAITHNDEALLSMLLRHSPPITIKHIIAAKNSYIMVILTKYWFLKKMPPLSLIRLEDGMTLLHLSMLPQYSADLVLFWLPEVVNDINKTPSHIFAQEIELSEQTKIQPDVATDMNETPLHTLARYPSQREGKQKCNIIYSNLSESRFLDLCSNTQLLFPIGIFKETEKGRDTVKTTLTKIAQRQKLAADAAYSKGIMPGRATQFYAHLHGLIQCAMNKVNDQNISQIKERSRSLRWTDTSIQDTKEQPTKVMSSTPRAHVGSGSRLDMILRNPIDEDLHMGGLVTSENQEILSMSIQQQDFSVKDQAKAVTSSLESSKNNRGLPEDNNTQDQGKKKRRPRSAPEPLLLEFTENQQ